MTPLCRLIATSLLVAGPAQAQLLPDPGPPKPATLASKTVKPDPFAGSHQPTPRVYGANVAIQPHDRFEPTYRRDPQLIGGVEVTPNVAIEAGYLNLPDRDKIKVDHSTPEDASIGLAEKGSSTHVAAKYTLPTEGAVSAYGKLGVSHSMLKETGKSHTGVYTGAGAKVQLERDTSLNAEFVRHGDAASRIGNVVKDGVKANMKIGF